jgi:acetyl-CoA acyltransferase
MAAAFICDVVRTPFGRYGGALSSVRADDLAAEPLKTLVSRNSSVDWETVDDVIYGCANQAGEDNRNVARMALLLAGLPHTVPGVTVNRLCASSLEAAAIAARSIQAGAADLVVAGGVESMSRAPFVLAKTAKPFSREARLEDTTIGWRFVNPAMRARCGVDSMPETAENVAKDFSVSRADQDAFAVRSQQRAEAARLAGFLAEEIAPVLLPRKDGEPIVVSEDEQPRPGTTLEALSRLKGVVRPDGSVTAGNSSSVNDGAVAILIASEAAVRRYDLKPLARVVCAGASGVEPRIMGIGPTEAVRKVLARGQIGLEAVDVVELNEAFAAQALAVTRQLGLSDSDPRVNPNGGAIALGHPLGASGGRLIGSACRQLQRQGGRYGLATMCVGVGQGVAMLLEAA